MYSLLIVLAICSVVIMCGLQLQLLKRCTCMLGSNTITMNEDGSLGGAYGRSVFAFSIMTIVIAIVIFVLFVLHMAKGYRILSTFKMVVLAVSVVNCAISIVNASFNIQVQKDFKTLMEEGKMGFSSKYGVLNWTNVAGIGLGCILFGIMQYQIRSQKITNRTMISTTEL
jgi:glucan phosphoethanolaminetransferase (alkaline phosphatase superfamily)